VFCTDRDSAAAEATAARIRAAGGRAAASVLDVCDRVAVDAAVAAVVRDFCRLDIVLESAGISHRLNFLDVDAETWDPTPIASISPATACAGCDHEQPARIDHQADWSPSTVTRRVHQFDKAVQHVIAYKEAPTTEDCSWPK
jgi:NAD(P)-dependent dehydrogenase (short-subunit alcohol dehydrogenase family)